MERAVLWHGTAKIALAAVNSFLKTVSTKNPLQCPVSWASSELVISICVGSLKTTEEGVGEQKGSKRLADKKGTRYCRKHVIQAGKASPMCIARLRHLWWIRLSLHESFTLYKLVLMEMVVRSFGKYKRTGKHQDGLEQSVPTHPSYVEHLLLPEIL